MRKKTLKELDRSGSRAATILLVLLAVFLVLIYDVVWTHFHQTGFWNFFSIIAILLVAVVPTLYNFLQGYTKIEQAYIDKMLELMLTNDLRKSHMGDEVRKVANILTQTTLEALSPIGWSAKGRILLFLKRSDLINKDNPIINLSGVDLYNAKCTEGIDLSNVDLSGALLACAKLRGANLSGSNLSGISLSGADLSWAELRSTDLRGAHLDDAKLYNVHLIDANLEGARMEEKGLNGLFIGNTVMPDGTLRQAPGTENY